MSAPEVMGPESVGEQPQTPLSGNVNISAAAREGVAAAMKRAMDQVDRAAYQRFPEQHDSFWDDAQAWGAE